VNQLLIGLVALFLIECILQVYGRVTLQRWFALSLTTIKAHQYWRLITYQFLHEAPWPLHILFNGIGLWFFGRAVLEAVGTRRFWQIYLASGFFGGLVEIACHAWHPAYQPGLVVGASASVLGLAGAYCFLFQGGEVVCFLYFIPIRLKAMTLFWILFGMSAFGIVFPYGAVAHGAHLGGLLTGVAFVRFVLNEDARAWLRRLAPRRVTRRDAIPVPAGKVAERSTRSSLPAAEMDTPEDFIRREVDPILDKISAHGIQSLTEREKRILEKARERMRNR
jgi:membrane associated rhomboid family serine protease